VSSGAISNPPRVTELPEATDTEDPELTVKI
jgi:hypothetical protein